MEALKRILVVQTAFIGDVVLTLPLVQVLNDRFPDADIDVVVVPRAADVCRNHPALRRVIEYDKRGKERGWDALLAKAAKLRRGRYDVAFLPHRSLRSAVLAFLAGIPRRIGFRTSAGRFVYTERIRYDGKAHEIMRNLALLQGIGISEETMVLPKLYPGEDERSQVDRLISERGLAGNRSVVAIAPGTIWNTKRWLKERFAEVAAALARGGCGVFLVGGPEDVALGSEIEMLAADARVHNLTGKLSLLGSAELIRRSRVLITNDSAPMHLGVAVQTPVVAIFGATIPGFGFGPPGPDDTVIETLGLTCRPCSIHGGNQCPIGTFDCMKNISSERVLGKVMEKLSSVPAQR